MIAKKEKKRSLSGETNKSSIAKQHIPKKLKAENDVPKSLIDSPKKKKEKKVINKLLEKSEKSDKTKLKPNKNLLSNNKSSIADKSVDGKSDKTVKSRTQKRRSLMQKFIPMEQLKKRIQDLQAEDSLSKSAKKRLTIFKRKLTLMETGAAPTTLEEHKAKLEARLAENFNVFAKKDAQKQAQKRKEESAKKNLKKPQSNKQNKKNVQQSQVVAKSDEEEDETDEEDDEEMENENVSSIKQNAKKVIMTKHKTKREEEEDEDEDDDDDDNDDEEDEEEDDESEDENDVPQVQMETDSDEVEQDDDEDEDDEVAKPEESEESESEEEETTTKKNNPVPKKVTTKNENEGKKKRYVLFVGNLPYTADKDQIEKHFLTRVSEVISVRMPLKPDGKGTRGFAYVEFSNQTDYEKGLTLHESFLAGRKLNVQYSDPNAKSKDKNKIIGKNKKLQELRKAGKLAGSKPNKKFQQQKKQK